MNCETENTLIFTRGTTSLHEFITELPTDGIDVLYVTYCQNDEVIVEKTISDATLEESKISVTLSQTDTLLFTAGRATCQIRVKYTNNSAFATDEVGCIVKEVLKEGEI